MKVGDLVISAINDATGLGVGIIMDFDHDDDPIVFFSQYDNEATAFYRHTLEVISEAR